MKILFPLLILLTGLLLGSAIGIATLGSPAPASVGLSDMIKFESVTPASATKPDSDMDARLLSELSKLGDSLTSLEADNRTLRRQLAETNRDLAELQFQVDSHSESFRPLGDSTGNRGATPFSSPTLQPLLPPKR